MINSEFQSNELNQQQNEKGEKTHRRAKTFQFGEFVGVPPSEEVNVPQPTNQPIELSVTTKCFHKTYFDI